jgi:glycosyltransferase involved in cell wall biosynthesis
MEKPRVRIGIDCRKIFDFGIGTYIHELVQALSALPVSEDYVLFTPPGAVDLLPDAFERVVTSIPNYSLTEQLRMPREIDRARLDLFHSPHIIVPLFTRCRLVVTIHDVIPFYFPPRNPIAAAAMIGMTARAARAGARVLTVSEASKRELARTIDCDPAKIVVTPNGIGERFFAAGPANTKHGRYVLYAGNDKPHKNVAGLVAAMEIVRERHRDVRLVVCGAPFERYRDREGVEGIGFVSAEELAALFRGAVAFALPSFQEGFGLPALEAMAAGTPVVTSATPAMLEVTGDAALHVDPHSCTSIAEGILRVIDDPQVRERLRNAGPRRAREFKWSRCAALTRDAYLAAIARA